MADSSAQLTLAALEAAQARVPAAVWTQLTALQQGFVAALAAEPTLPLIEAARRAGSKRPRQTGSAWANDPKVKAALDHLRAVAQAQAEDAFTYVTRRLKENDLAAKTVGDYGASNGALGLFAKVQGLLEKRVRIKFEDPAQMVAHLKALPLAERKQVILEMLAE